MQTVVDRVQPLRARRVRAPLRVRRKSVVLATAALVFGICISSVESVAFAGSSSNFDLVAGSGGSPNPPGSTGTSSLLVGFASPSGVVADTSGNLLVADTSNGEVDLVVRGSTARYLVNNVTAPVIGDTYVLAGGGAAAPLTSGTPATSVGGLLPGAVAQDASGNVLIADISNSEVDVVAESALNPGYAITGAWTVGDLYVLAGGGAISPTVGGGVATSAVLNQPRGIAIDGAGDLIIADTSDNEVDLLALAGTGSGGSRTPGDLYVIAGGGTAGAPTASGLVATTAQLNQPNGVAVDVHGNIAVADTSHNAVDILAMSASDPGYGIGSSWSSGNVYRMLGGGASVAGTGGVSAALSKLSAPQGVTFDATGDLIVADTNHSVVEVLAIAGEDPGYALGGSGAWTTGDLYVIAGDGLSNVSSSGTVANQSLLYAPIGVAVLPDGSLSVIDQSSTLLDRLILSPSIPKALSATSEDAAVALSWSAPASDGGSVLSDYVVYVYDHGQALPIATEDLGSTATSLTVAGLSNAVAYDFSVVAQNAIGTSANSIRAQGTPVAPVSLPVVTPSTAVQIATTAPVATPTATAPQTKPAPVAVTIIPVGATVVAVPRTAVFPASVSRPRVSMLRVPVDTTARGLSFAISCNSKICRGSITVTTRHLVRIAVGTGTISIYEESVVARVNYRDGSIRSRVVRVPLTSYGRGMIRLLSVKGTSVIATATTRGGATTRRRFQLYSYGARAKKT